MAKFIALIMKCIYNVFLCIGVSSTESDGKANSGIDPIGVFFTFISFDSSFDIDDANDDSFNINDDDDDDDDDDDAFGNIDLFINLTLYDWISIIIDNNNVNSNTNDTISH